MSNFIQLQQAVQKQIKVIQDNTLLQSAISKDDLWDTYLASFPEGSNPIFRERTHHDCNC